jgi:hypothetical protein
VRLLLPALQEAMVFENKGALDAFRERCRDAQLRVRAYYWQ